MSAQAIFWVVAFVALIVVELATVGLVTVWFAVGSIAAFFVAMFGGSWIVQLAVFAVVSAALLFLVRPMAKKRLDDKVEYTNAEALPGTRVKVTQAVDNIAGTGAAMVNGQEWTARSVKDDVTFAEDEVAIVAEISGVKLLLKKENA